MLYLRKYVINVCMYVHSTTRTEDDVTGILGTVYRLRVGRDSVVGIATCYGLDGPVWGEIFRTRPDRPYGLPSLLYNGYRVFPRDKAAGAWC